MNFSNLYNYPEGFVSLSTMAKELNIDNKYIIKFLQDAGYINDIRTPTKYGLAHGIRVFKDGKSKWPIYSKEIQSFAADNLEYMKKAYKYAFQKGGFVQEGPVMFGTKCVGSSTICFSKPLKSQTTNGTELYLVTIHEDITRTDCAVKTLQFVSDKQNCVPLFDKEEDVAFYLNNFENDSIVFVKRKCEKDLVQEALDKYHAERENSKSLKKEIEQMKDTVKQQNEEITDLYKQIYELERKLAQYDTDYEFEEE